MADIKLTLAVLPERFAVCRLGPSEDLPAWATRAPVFSITRTRDELSIVCPEENIPADTRSAKGWRALRLVGTFDFA
ncbi:MAG: ACT domain-containing protein, partial [Acidobacteria bacterium]